MSPPGPVDIATARRAADSEELARAKAAGDWGAALDVIHANLHEVESLVVRALSKQDGTNALLEQLLVRVGELVEAIENPAPPPAPSYRPSMASANQIDAQALGDSIERVDRQHHGSILVLGGRVEVLEKKIGEIPDPTRGTKGSGIAEIVYRLDSKATIARFALLAALASAAGSQVAELAKFIFHALKG